MKLTLRSVFCLALIAGMAGRALADCDDACDSDCSDTYTHYGCGKDNYVCARPDILPFSQGMNRARDYMGQGHLMNIDGLEDWNWVKAAAFEYQHSFNPERLGRYFSPACECTNGNQFVVGENLDGTIDIRAEDLGMSPTFRGTLELKPKIENFIFEPSFYLGMDRWAEGLYMWSKLPIAYTIWTMETCETTTQRGGSAFAPNVMENRLTTTTGLYVNRGNYAGPRTIDSICKAFSGKYTFGDKDIPLQAGRIICNCPQDKVGIADIPLHLGYTLVDGDRGNLGLYARTVFPTGTMEVNRSIFDPRIGYRRWQLGGGLQGQVRLFENDEQTTSMYFFGDANVTHVFKGEECRLFDMKTGTYRPTDTKWSRYLLMKEFEDVAGTLTYNGRLRNFADIFTVCVKSGFDWLVDGLFYFNLKHKNWNFDLGYEIKARDCESFDCPANLCDPCTYSDCDECCGTSTVRYFGVKGVQYVSDNYIDYSTTYGMGSIKHTDNTAGNGTAAALTNVIATTDTLSDVVDVNSGMRPRMVAHKVFGNIGYTWDVGEAKFFDNHGPIFFDLGAEAELGAKNKAVRSWGVWGKCGYAYN
ncbi:hypothetical protein JW872_02430 [Candidatus Babeliales bacterium]|nr:hypothetical protein [Candidatus Babeliales bacterium]